MHFKIQNTAFRIRIGLTLRLRRVFIFQNDKINYTRCASGILALIRYISARRTIVNIDRARERMQNVNENAKLNIGKNKFDYSNELIRRGDGAEVLRDCCVPEMFPLRGMVLLLFYLFDFVEIYHSCELAYKILLFRKYRT